VLDLTKVNQYTKSYNQFTVFMFIAHLAVVMTTVIGSSKIIRK